MGHGNVWIHQGDVDSAATSFFCQLGFGKESEGVARDRQCRSTSADGIVDRPLRESPRILTACRVYGNTLRSVTAPTFTELLP